MKGGTAMYTLVWLSRLLVEACLATLLVALAIANLSGVSIFDQLVERYTFPNGADRMDVNNEEGKRVAVAAPSTAVPRAPLPSTLREEMEKAGIGTSACFDQRRSNPSEYYICLGRVPCHELQQANGHLRSAPHIFKTSKGQRKEIEVIRNVVMHLQKHLGTPDLRTIFEHVKNIGLACDKFDAS